MALLCHAPMHTQRFRPLQHLDSGVVCALLLEAQGLDGKHVTLMCNRLAILESMPMIAECRCVDGHFDNHLATVATNEANRLIMIKGTMPEKVHCASSFP